MTKHSRIYLIGPMGAGKTTIGRRVARRLQFDFRDTDLEIEKCTGVDISTIFDYEGESGFRDRETRMLEALSTREDCVIATGGGSVLRQENRRCMARTGFVVHLRVSVAQSLRRTRRNTTRPLLQSPNPEDILQRLARERGPLYEAIADCEVDTDKHKSITLRDQILDLYKAYRNEDNA